MALQCDRATPQRDGETFAYPAAADQVFYAGGLVVMNRGLAQPGFTGLGLTAVGRCAHHADTTGMADGAAYVEVKRGVFRFRNSAGPDRITLSDVGAFCCIVDDETVALTGGNGNRSVAGKIEDVDTAGVWVRIS